MKRFVICCDNNDLVNEKLCIMDTNNRLDSDVAMRWEPITAAESFEKAEALLKEISDIGVSRYLDNFIQ